MSNSEHDSGRGPGSGPSTQPRALIHKKILEAATSNPNASLQTLADGVSGASVDLVDRVLDEYGDPASEDEASATSDEPDSGTDPSSDADGPATGAEDGDAPTLIADGATNGADLDGNAGGHDERESAIAVNEPDGDGTTGDSTATGSASGESRSDESASGESRSDESASGESRSDESASDDASSDDTASADSTAGDSVADRPESVAERTVSPDQFDRKELAVLEAVLQRPTATQEAIAADLDVSRATVSRRVSDIEGFEWTDRADFVARVFDTDLSPGEHVERNDGVTADLADSVADLTATVDDLSSDVERLEAELDSRDGETAGGDERHGEDEGSSDVEPGREETSIPDEEAASADRSDRARSDATGPLSDPDLAHKVVHACMDADYVTEDEELRIVKGILDDGRA